MGPREASLNLLVLLLLSIVIGMYLWMGATLAEQRFSRHKYYRFLRIFFMFFWFPVFVVILLYQKVEDIIWRIFKK